MLSKALQSILRRYFGQFITGLQNVELAFWTGKINIQNASFKHQRINELLKGHNIPLSIKFSFLGNLQIDVPWNKLTSAPVEIKVSNVMIVLKLQKVIGSKADVQNLKQHAKLILIKNYLAHLIKKSEEIKSEQSTQSGFLQKLFTKILHNLNLQVNNIHIRIENNNNTIIQSDNADDEFVDCKDESQIQNLGFSLGFCLESVQAQTINANNIKQFVKIENEKTEIRKKINLKQISLYWQENTSINLFQYPQERKIEFLRKIINRTEHRLLTIDGQILMERGKGNLDYFFSTSFRLLEIGLNYQQLKQFIEVYQQFINAKTKKKIHKMKEIDYSQQLTLQNDFKKLFKQLQDCDFKEVNSKDINLLESIDKKLLMKWTKQQVIQIIKKTKIKQAFENKNKRTWIGFLSKNVQNQLSQEQISTIQQQIHKFINMIEQQSFAKSIGFYLHFSLLRLVMDHNRVQQQLLFSAENIQLQFQGNKGDKKASLEIADVSLIYSDLIKHSEVNIIKNYYSENKEKYFSLRVDDSKKLQKVDISIGEMKVIHQIQFLSFLAELIKLRQRQKIKSQMVIISPQLKIKSQQNESSLQKVYQCNILMKKLQVMIELSSTSRLNAYIQSITVSRQKEVNSHSTKIANLGILFLQKQGQASKNYNILDDLNIQIILRKKLQIVQSSIPLFRITLNQQSLYYIVHCMKDQYDIIKIRSVQNTNQVIGEQKLMEGQTSIISVFKAVNVYHCILTSQYLYFYQKENNNIKYQNLIKKLLLRNIKISKIDSHTFKLESVLVNQIITCKDELDTDKWIYQIQQRIFDNSTKMQIFNMMDENDGQSPAIYIPYDSLIQMQVNRLEIIYQKNCEDKIMSVDLRRLKVSLKENNLQFQRKIDLDQIRIVNLTLTQQKRQQYIQYFQDLDEQEQPRPNIELLIEGKKKTHPKYTGELTIKSRINKLFINYNAEFAYSILYRLLVGDVKNSYYTEQAKYLKIFQYIKDILQSKNNIDQRYAQAKQFQFDKSYVSLQKYKQIYSCLVLFHVQIKLQQLLGNR